MASVTVASASKSLTAQGEAVRFPPQVVQLVDQYIKVRHEPRLLKLRPYQ